VHKDRQAIRRLPASRDDVDEADDPAVRMSTDYYQFAEILVQGDKYPSISDGLCEDDFVA
jgi:hypothetical protein